MKNNPLVYTDPSGHGWFSDIVDAVTKPLKPIVDPIVDFVEEVILEPLEEFYKENEEILRPLVVVTAVVVAGVLSGGNPYVMSVAKTITTGLVYGLSVKDTVGLMLSDSVMATSLNIIKFTAVRDVDTLLGTSFEDSVPTGCYGTAVSFVPYATSLYSIIMFDDIWKDKEKENQI